jgi:hypothetical protein
MLVKTLKTTKPVSLAIFFGLGLVFFGLKLPIDSSFIYTQSGFPLFDLLQIVTFQQHWLISIFSFALVLVLAMGWNNILSDKGVLKNNSVLPSVIVLFFFVPFQFTPVLPVCFLSLFLLHKVFNMYQKDRPYMDIFDAGLLVGTCFLFYPPAIFFLPFLLFCIFLYGNIQWRNFVIPLLAFSAPLLIFWGVHYCFNTSEGVLEHYRNSLSLSLPSIELPEHVLAWTILLAVLLLLSLKKMLLWLSTNSLRARKAFGALFLFCVCIVMGLFVESAQGWNHFLLFCLPISVLLSNYFLYLEKRWWSEGLFILMLISLLYFQIASL